MTQIGLFSTPPSRSRPRLPSRNRDPRSSFTAAVQLASSGQLGKQCLETLKLLAAYPGEPTSMELAQGNRLVRFTLARRLADLRAKGREYVENGPTRECRFTGRDSLTWKLTAAGRAALNS